MFNTVDYIVNYAFSQLQGSECQSTCAAGYYSDKGQCQRCYMSCKTCSGPMQNECVACPAGWQLMAGQCRPTCPEGYYKTDFGCQKCYYSCRDCPGKYRSRLLLKADLGDESGDFAELGVCEGSGRTAVTYRVIQRKVST